MQEKNATNCSWNKYYLSKILIRILPWDTWLPRCSKNLARSCQDSQDASKRVNPGKQRHNFIEMEKQNYDAAASFPVIQQSVHGFHMYPQTIARG